MDMPETETPAAKCPVNMHDGTPCRRAPYDENGLCICHSRMPDKDHAILVDEIRAMLDTGNYDFSRFVFPHGWWFRDRAFNGQVWFVDTHFLGHTDFKAASFKGDALFVGTVFGGETVLTSTEFHAAADFVNARFGDKVDLGVAKFHGEVFFRQVTFQCDADFGGVTFSKTACFEGARFEGEAGLSSAKFLGGAEFWGAAFQGAADFRDATFQREADFQDATFQGEADFARARFEREVRFGGEGNDRVFTSEADVDFRYARFGQPENVVFQHVSLGRARFLDTDVRHVDFTDVEWARRPFWRPRWVKPRGRFAVWDELEPEEAEADKDHALIGKLYRQLKHNYEEQRDPITAGDFHFGEMHMRRLSNPSRSPLVRFLKRNLSFLALYRWISGYGEDYLLPLAWIVGVILVFAAAFAFTPALALQTNPPSGMPQPIHGAWPHLLYSVMCFLLRGDKPFQPAHLAGHYVSVAEGILGPPLIAMFVLALNRRFKR